jgi:hypothetical protein
MAQLFTRDNVTDTEERNMGEQIMNYDLERREIYSLTEHFT